MKELGEFRNFDKYLGKWEIVGIKKGIENILELSLNTIQCPHCGGKFGDKKEYIFERIEILKESNRKKHLGVTDCGRYIILEEYLDDQKIKELVS